MRLPILSVLCLLFIATSTLLAQNEWDRLLDRYDRICRQCIEMREMIGRGEAVPSNRVSSLLGELKVLRARLKDTSDSMSPQQKRRYEAIRDSYALRFGTEQDSAQHQRRGVQRLFASIVPLPPAKVSHQTCAEPLLTRVAPLSHKSVYRLGIELLCSFSNPLQYGVGVSAGAGRWGGFIAAMSSFTPVHPSYICTSTGQIEGGGAFWGDGAVRRSAYVVCAGPTYRAIEWLDLQLGLGYASKTCCWRDLGGEWAEVSDLGYASLCAQAGAKFLLKGFSLSASARYVAASKELIPQLGLGCEF